MTKQELLKDLFERVLDEIKTVERCKCSCYNENDNKRWRFYQDKGDKLTEEIRSIVDELIKAE